MVRLPALLVVPLALLANSVSADFYSHRYGGLSFLDSELSGYCAEAETFVSRLNSDTQTATQINCNERGGGVKLYVGWHWTPYLAFETDLRQLAKSELRFDVNNPQVPYLAVKDRTTTRMGNAFLVTHLPVGREGLSIFGKLGGGFWLGEFRESQQGQAVFNVNLEDGSAVPVTAAVSGNFGENDSGFHWAYGAGISYRHRNSWTLRAEWEAFPDVGSDALRAHYQAETTSLGLSMHF